MDLFGLIKVFHFMELYVETSEVMQLMNFNLLMILIADAILWHNT